MSDVYGYDGTAYGVGDRVEIHPGTDLWMRGARYGVVEGLEGKTMQATTEQRWWYAYVPLLWAGSGGNRLKGKFRATEQEVRDAFGHCATIHPNGVINFYKRP